MNRNLVLLIIACAGMSRAQAQFISPVRIDSFLLDLYSKDVFNGGLAVVDQGKTVYIGTFGIADSEPTLLAKETPFPAGELAQPFTAWAVTRFISEGALRFEDAITTLFPTLSDSTYGTVTVRDLMHHTSGLPTYSTLLGEYSYCFNNSISNPEIINVLEKATPELKFPPGSQYESNPVNYAVLTLIVEQLTKQPFRTYMQSALFDSLGITIPHDSMPRVAGLVRSGDAFYPVDSASYYGSYGKVQPLLSLDDWIAWLKYLDTPERWGSAHYKLFTSYPSLYLTPDPYRELMGLERQWPDYVSTLYFDDFQNGMSLYLQYRLTDKMSFILFDNASMNKGDFETIIKLLKDMIQLEIGRARYKLNVSIDMNSQIKDISRAYSSLSVSEVYSKIAQIDDWSAWQSGVDRVYNTHTNGESVEWKMKVSGKKVKGETHTLNPPYSIGWTESRFGIRRIINCRIYSMKDGCEIEIHSSTSGLFAKLFTQKNELRSKQRIDELLQEF